MLLKYYYFNDFILNEKINNLFKLTSLFIDKISLILLNDRLQKSCILIADSNLSYL